MTEPLDLGDAISAQVRKYRQMKHWSVRRLAEECERLGMPSLTEASLGNIERGQKADAKRGIRRVLFEELVVLGIALDVPPLLLALPLGEGATVNLSPKLTVPSWDAMKWLMGEAGIKGRDSQTAMGTIGFYRDHDELVGAIEFNRSAKTGLADSYVERLRDHRKNMRRAGLAPPELPKELKGIDQQVTGE